MRAVSEDLFERFCQANAIPCKRVGTGSERTPDFEITVGGVRVACELKQLDPNAEDLQELADLRKNRATGRYLPNRLRGKLKKNASAQLKKASSSGCPTMLVIYDNSPFKSYTDHGDVIEAMFGRNSVSVSGPKDRTLPSVVSAPFFAGNGVLAHRGTPPSALSQFSREDPPRPGACAFTTAHLRRFCSSPNFWLAFQ